MLQRACLGSGCDLLPAEMLSSHPGSPAQDCIKQTARLQHQLGELAQILASPSPMLTVGYTTVCGELLWSREC